MPEKPEVVTVAKTLEKIILNKKITDIKVLWDNIIEFPTVEEFKSSILNQEVRSISTKGKWILIELTNDYLLVHLRMEGKFFFRNKTDELNKHEHVIITLDDNQEMRFHDTRKFGKMHLINKKEVFKRKPLSELGLEYDDKKLTSNYLIEKFKNKKIPIKSVLLDQSIITGIGNIYDDEILFLSRLNPYKRPCDLTIDECNLIIKYTDEVLSKAIEMGGTTIKSFTSAEGVHGLFQHQLLVHGKKICPKCNVNLEKVKINGRGTYYCKDCQK